MHSLSTSVTPQLAILSSLAFFGKVKAIQFFCYLQFLLLVLPFLSWFLKVIVLLRKNYQN